MGRPANKWAITAKACWCLQMGCVIYKWGRRINTVSFTVTNGCPANKRAVTAKACWCLQMGSIIYKWDHLIYKWVVAFINGLCCYYMRHVVYKWGNFGGTCSFGTNGAPYIQGILGASLSWLYCDNSYIASSATDVSILLVCMALHPQITCRHCSKLQFHAYIDMNVTKQQYSKPINCFWFTQEHWQVARQLQFHCLSRLNQLIPCVCAFTYLSSSIKITADTSSFSCPCCSVLQSSACSCKSHTWAR